MKFRTIALAAIFALGSTLAVAQGAGGGGAGGGGAGGAGAGGAGAGCRCGGGNGPATASGQGAPSKYSRDAVGLGGPRLLATKETSQALEHVNEADQLPKNRGLLRRLTAA